MRAWLAPTLSLVLIACGDAASTGVDASATSGADAAARADAASTNPDAATTVHPDAAATVHPDAANDDAATMGNDDAASMGNPDAATMGNPDAATMGNPDAATMGNPDAVTMGNPDAATMVDPDAATVGGPDASGMSGNNAIIESLGGVETVRAHACLGANTAWTGTMVRNDPASGTGMANLSWDFQGGNTAQLSFSVAMNGALPGTFSVTETLTLSAGPQPGGFTITTNGNYTMTYSIMGVPPVSGIRHEVYNVQVGRFPMQCP